MTRSIALQLSMFGALTCWGQSRCTERSLGPNAGEKIASALAWKVFWADIESPLSSVPVLVARTGEEWVVQASSLRVRVHLQAVPSGEMGAVIAVSSMGKIPGTDELGDYLRMKAGACAAPNATQPPPDRGPSNASIPRSRVNNCTEAAKRAVLGNVCRMSIILRESSWQPEAEVFSSTQLEALQAQISFYLHSEITSDAQVIVPLHIPSDPVLYVYVEALDREQSGVAIFVHGDNGQWIGQKYAYDSPKNDFKRLISKIVTKRLLAFAFRQK